MSSSILPGSILNDVLSLIPPRTTGAIAAPLGETEEAVRTAMATGSARILEALADVTVKPSGFWRNIWNLVSSPAISGAAGLAALSTGTPTPEQTNLGSSFLGTVFGGQQATIADELTHEGGLNAGSGARILGFVAPLVLAWLSQQVREQGLNASTIANVFGSDGSELRTVVPIAPPAGFKGVLPLWPILGVLFLTGLVWYVLHLHVE
jgi:hypothetical protein